MPPGRSRGIDGLCEDSVSQARLDAVEEHEIDARVEEAFEQGLRIHVGVKGFLLKLDEEVQITGVRGIVASRRAKEGQLCDSQVTDGGHVGGEDAENFSGRAIRHST